METWESKLAEARRTSFVGRERELGHIGDFIDQDCGDWLHIFGVGGIGKTALLRAALDRAEEAGWRVSYLDAGHRSASPPAVRDEIENLLQVTPPGAPHLVAIDSFEAFEALEAWFCRELVPALPDSVCLLSAGRARLEVGEDGETSGVNALAQMELGEFSESESRRYLGERGVSETVAADIVELAGGVPIVLSVAADTALSGGADAPTSALGADDLRQLMQRILSHDTSAEQRRALRAAALVDVVSEDILASMIPDVEPRELYQWLAQRSYVESTANGLQPHPVVRELIDDQARASAPVVRERLIDRARDHYLERLRGARGQPAKSLLSSFLHLAQRASCDSPEGLGEGPATYFDRIRPDDPIVELVEKHEGPEAAQMAAHWHERFSSHGTTVRFADGQLAGFVLYVPLEKLGAGDLGVDPGVDALVEYVDREAPIRSGEIAPVARFWMSVDGYQRDGAIQTQLFWNMVARMAWAPGATTGTSVHRNPDHWLGRDRNFLVEYARWTSDGHTYGALGRDWRRYDPTEFLGNHLRVLRTGRPLQWCALAERDVVLLERGDFAEAVKEALKNFDRGDRLAACPLARSCMALVDGAVCEDPGQRAARLRQLLTEACESVAHDTEGSRYVELLRRTFLESDATQREVAEQMELSYSHFRRKLGEAIERVVEWLWRRETHRDAI